jgi:tripeptide aminopeptidase
MDSSAGITPARINVPYGADKSRPREDSLSDNSKTDTDISTEEKDQLSISLWNDRKMPKVDSKRLEETFISAAKIWSPSGQEKEMAVKMKTDFEAMKIPGLTVQIDDVADKAGSDTGNVIVNIPASLDAPKDSKAICISFHLDRVPVRAPGVPEDEPVQIERTPDGTIRSKDSRTNIAADDRTGYAVVTEAIRNITKSGIPHGNIRVIGFVSEETGLHGAKHLDPRYVQGFDYGFEMDGGKVGNVIRGGAGIHHFTAVITGTSAPSIHPSQGKNALLAGIDAVSRLSSDDFKQPGQLLNISNFYSGKRYDNGRSVTNAVPDNAEIAGEFRGKTREDEDALKNRVKSVLEETGKAHGVEISMKDESMEGYLLSENSPAVKLAEIATKAAGIKPKTLTTMGGSDANYMNLKGLPTVVLGSGAFLQHTEREYTTSNALVSATRVVMSLIAAAANPAVAAALMETCGK